MHEAESGGEEGEDSRIWELLSSNGTGTDSKHVPK